LFHRRSTRYVSPPANGHDDIFAGAPAIDFTAFVLECTVHDSMED